VGYTSIMAGTSKKENRYADLESGHRLVNLVASGLTLHAASKRLNLPWRTAQEQFSRTLADIADERTKQEVLHTELATLAMMQQAHMPAALRGDTDAARTVLQILDRRSKYLGLDEAIKVQVLGKEVERAVETISQIVEGEIAEVVEMKRIGA